MEHRQDQWAYRLLCEYIETRKRLRAYHQELTQRINQGEELLRGEREWVGSMLHESTEVIPKIATYCSVDQLEPRERRMVLRLQRLAHGKKSKVQLWDNEWMQRLPDQRDWEEELIARLDGEESEGKISVSLSNLAERQREAIEMLASGMSYSDVAEMMCIAKGSVSKHLQLARKKLASGAQLEWCID
ncbi:hypothetical protein DNHGIG_31640 [Collibacillus ludicampi]|uniref:HTH luxR-type domain-containing protein n=1 Tax=Collibacillus ludicampi TaxID=2771369 RepID=A0AAV4LIJ0_9BACL|nr:sigma factor-like helix-turn-helix DNA-binding protein [Collibacillus ludicampi]GIM47615.1 hypothetical protein DNHGIG_31640 [Collibacillus ludicampi]